jgi:hypothetical protein
VLTAAPVPAAAAMTAAVPAPAVALLVSFTVFFFMVGHAVVLRD